jgi:DNA-binding MarR family transcriptional regulator/N-acetylglutamate synthase-like GNAT family acetyltransferase
MSDSSFEGRVAAVRRFNRFYTQRIGILQERLQDSPFPLTESRVIYELAQRTQPTASEIGKDLGLDPGYLSRILSAFEKRGLIDRTPSKQDGRQQLLSLTDDGRAAFAALDARSRDEIGGMLSALPAAEQTRLVEAMRTMTELLGAEPERKVPYLLRSHQPGDIGWVTHRHGVLYAQEYGWDERFEAMVAEIAAKFIHDFDPKKERCWIAERNGEPIGCVFLVKQSDDTAKLRLLLVEPTARGLGVGSRLVGECMRFARQARYEKIMLWTNSILVAARRIYEAAGFRLIHAEPHHSFGHDLVGETWELKL